MCNVRKLEEYPVLPVLHLVPVNVQCQKTGAMPFLLVDQARIRLLGDFHLSLLVL